MNADATSANAPKAKPARKAATPRVAKTKVVTPEVQAARPVTRKSTRKSASSFSDITPEQRQRMIEECAYFRALARGFSPGDSQRDWYEAEAQIDAHLALLLKTGATQHA